MTCSMLTALESMGSMLFLLTLVACSGAVGLVVLAFHRGRALQIVRAGDESLRKLVEESPVATIISAGPEQTVILVNRRFTELTGYTINDIPDVKHWWPLAYPDERLRTKIQSEWQDRVETAIREQGEIEPMEATIRCRDGSPRDVEFRLSSIGEKHIVTFVDLTERNRSIAALRSSEQQFRLLTENSPDIIVRYDRECRRVYMNPAGEKLMRLTSDQLLHASPGPEWKGDLPAEEYRSLIATVTRTGTPAKHVLRWTTPENQVLTFFVHLLPDRDDAGSISGAFAVARDITSVERSERRLEATELRYQQVFQASLDALYLMEVTEDGGFRTLDVNPAFEQTMGVSREALAGKPIEEAGLPAEATARILDRCRRCLNAGLPLSEEVDYALPAGKRFFQTSLVPIRDEDGRIHRLLGILSDITHQVRSQEEHREHMRFLEAMDQVHRGMQGVDDFDDAMGAVLDSVLDIFQCDRAWLLFPCDPNASSWGIPVERTLPDFPGALAQGNTIPMTEEVAESFRLVLASEGPIAFGPGNEHPLPTPDVADRYAFYSFMAVALRRATGPAWMFGLHQCSGPRVWSADERRLFQEIGRRLSDILAGLLTHRRLRESEERYRQVFQNTSDGLFLVDVLEDGRFRFSEFNPAEERSAGITSAAAAGRLVEEALPSELARQVTTNYRRCLDQEQAINYEEVLSLPAGRRSFNTTLIPIRDAQGRIHRIIGFSRDITERAAMLQSLETSNRHARSLLKLSRVLERAQSYSDVVTAAFEEVKEVIGYQRLWIYVLTGDRQEADGLIATSSGPPMQLPHLRIVGDPMLEEIATAVDMVVVEDATTDPRTNKEMVKQQGHRTLINVPIILFNNHLGSMGTGSFGDEGIHVPSPAERDYLTAIASHLAVSLDRIHTQSERNQAEEKARQLAAIVESSEDAIVGRTLDGIVTSWNRGAEKIFGYTSDEMLGQPLTRLFPEDRLAEEQRILDAARQGIPVQHHETVRRCKNGRLVDVSVSVSPLKDGEGRIIGVSKIARDISDRVRAEAERMAHLRFLSSLDQVNRAMQETDQLHMLARVMEVVLAAFGCDRVYLAHPCDPEASTLRVDVERSRPTYPSLPIGAEVANDGDQRQVQRTILSSSEPVRFLPGSVHSVPGNFAETYRVQSMLAMAIRPRGGDAYLFGIHQCSFERNWTNEELRLMQEIGHRLSDALTNLQTFRSLRDSEYRFRSFFERNNAVMLLIEPESGSIVDANPSAVKFYGYKREDLILMKIQDINELPTEEVARERRRAMADERNYFIFPHRLADGRTRMVEVHSTPVVVEERPLLFSIIHDITDRREAEEELRRHREHLEELVVARTSALEAANRELEAFSYSVSHDLRTPLRAIDGFTSMLARRLEDQLDDEGKRLVRVVRDNTAKMSQLIDDILAFSRSSHAEIRYVEIDMVQMVQDVWAELEPLRAGRDVNLNLGALPSAKGDRAMLRQVWSNLLGNAIKFTRDREEARIEVNGSLTDNALEYSVADNGVGFDPAFSHKLFGVFQRIHGVEEFEGTGIGLAIVKRIVDRHGGSVAAEGTMGQGATIRFRLPVQAQA